LSKFSNLNFRPSFIFVSIVFFRPIPGIGLALYQVWGTLL
jgi:hypothetical protein